MDKNNPPATNRVKSRTTLLYLHNAELLLNNELKPDVDDLFCRSASRSARRSTPTTRIGSEFQFCSCVETVLTIGHSPSQLNKLKGVLD